MPARRRRLFAGGYGNGVLDSPPLGLEGQRAQAQHRPVLEALFQPIAGREAELAAFDGVAAQHHRHVAAAGHADGEHLLPLGVVRRQLSQRRSFRLRKREPRKGRNPKTGDKVDVPPKKVPYFKPGKELKDLINRQAAEAPQGPEPVVPSIDIDTAAV